MPTPDYKIVFEWRQQVPLLGIAGATILCFYAHRMYRLMDRQLAAAVWLCVVFGSILISTISLFRASFASVPIVIGLLLVFVAGTYLTKKQGDSNRTRARLLVVVFCFAYAFLSSYVVDTKALTDAESGGKLAVTSGHVGIFDPTWAGFGGTRTGHIKVGNRMLNYFCCVISRRFSFGDLGGRLQQGRSVRIYSYNDKRYDVILRIEVEQQ